MQAFRPLDLGHYLIAVALLLVTLASSVPAQEARPAPREPIGEVLGTPVYRDELRTADPAELRSEVRGLFVAPLLERYRQAHKAEIEPTEAEILAVTELINMKHSERMEIEGPKLRQEIAAIEAQLARSDLAEKERRTLQNKKQGLEVQLRPPGRPVAVFLLGNWKLQKYFYGEYGGGRVLWQQFGVEAFDAMHQWLLAEEKKGAFHVADAELRSALYHYWTTQNHGAFLADDKEKIREALLEPEWLPKQFVR